MEEIFTVYKASQYCNVSSKTIINWIEAGHIRCRNVRSRGNLLRVA